MSIAIRLKVARQARAFTQNKLAEAIGVSRGVIANIEYEKTEPQPLVARAICTALHIREEWLLHGEGPMDLEGSSSQDDSMQILFEIFDLAKSLSRAEQDYILDLIRTYQRHRGAVRRAQSPEA